MKKLSTCNEHLSTYNYSIISEKQYHIDIGKYNTYGIISLTSDATVLRDVSTCKEQVINMINLFNQCQLSPIHLKDVVEDMLSQFI